MGVWHNTGQTRGWSWFTATKPVRAYLYGQPPYTSIPLYLYTYIPLYLYTSMVSPPYTTYQRLTYLTRVVWVDEPISEWMENWLTLVCTKRKPALHWLTNVWGNQKGGREGTLRAPICVLESLSYRSLVDCAHLIVLSEKYTFQSYCHL